MWLQIWVQQQSESSPLHPTQKYQRFSWRAFFCATQPVGKISVILRRIVEFSWQAQLHFEFKTQVHPSRLLNCQSWASKLFLCLAALQTVSVDALILCKSWVGRSFCVYLTEYPCVRRGFVLTLWFPPPVIKIVLNTKEKALLFFPLKRKTAAFFLCSHLAKPHTSFSDQRIMVMDDLWKCWHAPCYLNMIDQVFSKFFKRPEAWIGTKLSTSEQNVRQGSTCQVFYRSEDESFMLLFTSSALKIADC